MILTFKKTNIVYTFSFFSIFKKIHSPLCG